ncbi:MAG: hypothetical protein KF708_10030 [Pirellulales bacterium]|nr:hypothetical protein [Pirellulales bacterium]
MSSVSRAPAAPTPSASLPDPLIRTVVSLLLVVHLFFLGVAALSSSGNDQATSRLMLGLRRLPAYYLQLLDMDLNYKFYLTYGETFDVDQQLQIDVTLPDGNIRQVLIPEENIWPRVREQRYQMLAANVGSAVGNDAIEPLLPQALSGAVMAPLKASKATFRSRGHFVLNMDDARSPDLSVADPYDARRYRTLYEAQVVRTEEGQVNLVKTSDDDALFGGGSMNTPATTAPPPATTAPAPGTTSPAAPASGPAAPRSTP